MESVMPKMPIVPLPASGSCPPGYNRVGNMFMPTSSAKPAIEKNGSCHPGYQTVGNYCIAQSKNAKMIIPASGSCPPGFNRVGNYFMANKLD